MRLLAELDALHGTLEPATRKLCERASRCSTEMRHERLAALSNGHLHNLRHAQTDPRQRGAVGKTQPVKVTI